MRYVDEIINYGTATIMYELLNGLAPEYPRLVFDKNVF